MSRHIIKFREPIAIGDFLIQVIKRALEELEKENKVWYGENTITVIKSIHVFFDVMVESNSKRKGGEKE